MATSIPRIALPNPHNRKPSLSSTVAQADSARNTIVLDTVEEPVPPIPREHLHPQKAINDQDVGRAVSSYSPSIASQTYAPKASKEKTSSPQSKSNDSGYMSGGSASAKSPVVPIRSMFPVYNPQVSLAQQNYFPQRPAEARTSAASIPKLNRSDYPSPVRTWTPIDRALGPPSVPATVANFPMNSLTPLVSNLKQLSELWEATHGMEPTPMIKSYNLELARTEEATFVLGSEPATPFYTLITYDTNEIAVTKVSPRKQTLKCEVSVNSIEAPSRRLSPNDGLVTFIFPKMAAMLAITQSTELAKEHGLAPTHRDEVQAAAVKRAADQEACRLLWNNAEQHYELEHPAVGRRQREPQFIQSPNSAVCKPSTRPKLDIFVTKPSGRTLPVIIVAHPRSDLESASEPTLPGIRMSTIPQSDNDNALLTLDFNTRLMHINANQILEHVPSLFAIDSIVSATMTVAIADQSTNTIMAGMEVWQPKPSRAMSTYAPSIGGKSAAGSVFYATLAEREEAEEEARELAALHERDIKNKERRKKHSKWFGKSNEPKQKKTKSKKVVTREFDLEKLSHYQSGARKGEELPGVARILLRVMVGGLQLIVWFLTAIVRFFAWLLVLVTRGVTSEKF